MGDELVGNALCLDFTNTVNSWVDPRRDTLDDPARTVEWARAAGVGWAGAALQDGEIGSLRVLRQTVYDVMTAVIDGRPAPIDGWQQLLRGSADVLTRSTWTRAHNRLVARQDAPTSLSELGATICASAVQLLTTGPLDRLGRCPGCGWLFLDTSRNGRRRWCSMSTCGSRTKSARYYATHKA